MLSGFQGRDHLIGVQLQRSVDVDDVDVGIGQHFVVIGVSDLDAVLVTDLVQFGFGTLADRVHFSVRVLLIDGDEFGAEFQADDADFEDL
jgi:hypothetical protein